MKWQSENFEEWNLKSILANEILREIDENKTPKKQHKKLTELFKKFKKESYGAKIIFLLNSDYIKMNYNFELTEKGKKKMNQQTKKKASSESTPKSQDL